MCVCLSVTLSRSCCRLSSKVATLVEEVFRRAGYGVHIETLLVFVYKLLTNSVAQPAAAAAAPRYVPVADTFCTLWYPQTQTIGPPAAVPGSRPPDCRLLPPNPSRSKPRTAAAAAAQGTIRYVLYLMVSSDPNPAHSSPTHS